MANSPWYVGDTMPKRAALFLTKCAVSSGACLATYVMLNVLRYSPRARLLGEKIPGTISQWTVATGPLTYVMASLLTSWAESNYLLAKNRPLEDEVDRLRADIQTAEMQNVDLVIQIGRLEDRLGDPHGGGNRLQENIELQSKLWATKQKAKERKTTIQNLRGQLNKKRKEIARLRQAMRSETDGKLTLAKSRIAQLDSETKGLKAKVQELQNKDTTNDPAAELAKLKDILKGHFTPFMENLEDPVSMEKLVPNGTTVLSCGHTVSKDTLDGLPVKDHGKKECPTDNKPIDFHADNIKVNQILAAVEKMRKDGLLADLFPSE